jgi:hypothetical protein
MLPLLLSSQLESDKNFKARVNMAFNVVAHEVLAEDAEVPNHILRVNYANRILQLPMERIDAFIAGVIGAPSIQSTNAQSADQIPDDSILSAVRQCWNGLIGISDEVPT